ncbi:hypothetical protein GCM10012284_55270 [Mangrovihabitans endophyticus]|uniref:GDSL-like Lipase/Acylhydrolase family protein n=1 Tax=Mangrovihabitans endophyticus TaxID=1751298 RepID=A0A8J3C5W4_9ACTN|nr:hypothetical protein GCM10012284_55270 [Mangrovihabitans endophyticus]
MLTAALAAVSLVAASPAPAAPPAPADPAPTATPDSPSGPSIAPSDRDRLLSPSWRRSSDMAWTATGDAGGFHIMTASARTGYAWHTVTTLAEPGFDTDRWIGNACLTGSGRRLVVVYGPRTFTNRPALFDRGGFTAVVDLVSARVTKVALRASLAYFNPGCGTGETAVVTQLGASNGDEQTKLSGRSRLFRLDAAAAKLSAPTEVAAELTSAVPVGKNIVAAGAGRLVSVDAHGTMTRTAKTTGTAYDLHPDADGAVVYLDRSGQRGTAHRFHPGDDAPATLAEGPLEKMGLSAGAGGRVFLTGAPDRVAKLPGSVRRVNADADARVSSRGELAVTDVRTARDAQGTVIPPADDGTEAVHIDGKSTATGKTLSFTAAPAVATPKAASDGLAPHPSLASAPGDEPWHEGSPTNPVDTERWCSVPRNDPRNQAMQPKPRQVEWAIDQAITNTPYAARPANWKNLGMPAYSPLGLFPRIELDGGGRIPAQVMLGVVAQESNLWEASRVAVPGVTANPLIGNFYGRDIYNNDSSDDWDVFWEDSDCGYGVAQVTDGMRRQGFAKPGERLLPYDSQRAVALDFAANVAAGARILQDKWNQTRRAGLIIGDGNPMELENWFYALWAYNTGFHPDQHDGSPWGVGWVNNPINPRFDQSREPFMEDYEDARNPQRWPYEEKVLGFAGHPPELLEGVDSPVAAYRPAWWVSVDDRLSVKPPLQTFCTAANDCYPGEKHQPDAPDLETEPAGPCAHQNEFGQYDLQCWWNQPVTWKGPSQTGHEILRFDPGYAYQDDATSYPPNCTLSGLPSGALVIDDVKDVPSIRPNCPQLSNNAGTFGLQFAGTGDDGRFPSKVDFHQLGGGFGGHFWFAHTRNDRDFLKVTGTWTLNQQINGWARVMVHMPDVGAQTQQAAYEIDLGDGFGNGKKRVVLQRTREHRWVSLGAFPFSGTPKVRLSTQTYDGTGDEDIAWDAVAFQKLPGKPRNQVVALGDSYSSGEGASTNRGADYYKETDYKQLINNEVRFQNICHRSKYAWSRQAKLSDNSTSIGARADGWDPTMDYSMLACSGAETENILPNLTRPAGTSAPVNAWNEPGQGQYGELSQLDRGFLDENTTLVTMSIGGNDARFADVIQQCIFGAGLKVCQDTTLDGDSKPLTEAEPERINGPVRQSIETVLRQIHGQAPHAKIMLMGYPKLLEGLGNCIGGIGAAETPWLNDTADELAASMNQAVADVRAEGVQVWFANPISAFAGKAVCGDPETVNGVIKDLTSGEQGPLPGFLPESWNKYGASHQSFHPKIDGAGIYADVMNSVAQGQMGL